MANLDVGARYQSDQGAFTSPCAAHDGNQTRACGTHDALFGFAGRDGTGRLSRLLADICRRVELVMRLRQAGLGRQELMPD